MAAKDGIMSISQFITYFLVQLLMNEVLSFVPEHQKSARIEVNDENQIVLGGLFPVHAEGTSEDNRCGSMLTEKGIQRLEAMLYAIDQINNNSSFWKIKMGAVILDTCSSESYALEQSLQFLHYSCGPKANISRKVTAVVGASNSVVSASVANIFRLFQIPQVSYASTSEELDDLHKYPYFFRVVPSDRFQVQAILDILLEFKWTYVSMVVSKGDYGENAAQSLQALIRTSANDEICFAVEEILPRNATQENYDSVVRRLNRFEKAKVVIVFLNEDKISELFEACERCEIPPGRFLWIGSDGWGTKERVVQGHEKMVEGSLTILPKRYPLEGFDEYFKSLDPNRNDRNPWFKEFWENQFNCVFNRDTAARRKRKTCTGEEDLAKSYRQEGLVPMVIDSVHLLATAIKTMCERVPRFCKEPEKMEQKYREKFLEIIKNTTFNSAQGHGVVIKFDNTRSVSVNYSISEFRKLANFEDIFGYKVIGEWNPSKRLKVLRLPDWDMSGGIASRCSAECPDGEERIPNSEPQKRCCWSCRPCKGEEYLPDPKRPCQKCPEGTVPSSNKKTCIEQQIKYVGLDFKSPWALVPLIFSILGLISTSAVLVIFFLNQKTPIIMASGRELCYFILGGIIVCYSYSFVALLEPAEVSCGALRIGMGLGLSICYSAIFTKTNRLSRIFEVSMKMMKRPSYISPESQIVICVCLVLIQVTLTVLWLIITPPKVPKLFVEDERGWITYCEVDGISLLLGLMYNMFLLILCTIYAYKTRNIPENFNETKWISFTMYASCIIWLAFIPIYCSATKDYKVQAIILAMSVSSSGTVILACMFLPKIYIVLFRPERNVRYPTNSSATTGTSGSGQPVRYVRGASKTQDQLQQPSPIFSKPGSGSPFLLRTNHIQ
ncbi:metabotropic glutamate receptor 3-like isoform X2 [Argiope bruennichi]|uniref:Metabotropic glutamate receptor 3 like protein n=1 Tax=Argiope bruennichi TaxID=94029 RepID=A0A8T0EX83_ARGBR|nr:metabotropic glutamate receptor 3-like isoform X2 [Argiope bruennichi]KAF8782187.1 Metabotropic glutamate receptor 3 like protein [Argiope bruennichi]